MNKLLLATSIALLSMGGLQALDIRSNSCTRFTTTFMHTAAAVVASTVAFEGAKLALTCQDAPDPLTTCSGVCQITVVLGATAVYHAYKAGKYFVALTHDNVQ